MNKQYKPELRTIPLTFIDCEHLDKTICRWESKEAFKRVSLNGWLCEMLRSNGFCPKGFRS